MNKCSECGGTSFSLSGGLMICDQCGVEKQGYIELQSQECISEVDRSRLSKKIVNEGETKSVEEEKELNNWTSYEAYNIILHEWTQALCGLGASPHFKQVVFKLWAMYLHHNEIAFLKPGHSHKPNVQPKVSFLQSPRDVQLIIQGKRSVSPISNASSKRKKKKKISSRMEKMIERLERHKTHQEENVRKKSSSISNMLATELSKSLNEFELSSLNLNTSASVLTEDSSVYTENMCHPSDTSNNGFKTEQTSTTASSDVHIYSSDNSEPKSECQPLAPRWCREGHIPYLSAQYLLKPDMKIFRCDLPMLKDLQIIPDAELLRTIAGNLSVLFSIQFLSLPSVSDVMIRFVKLFSLPESVGIMAQELVLLGSKMIKPLQGVRIPAIEVMAMAAIIVVLKAYCGIDGTTEVQLSHFAVKINEEIQPHNTISPLFSWVEWERHVCKLIWFCSHVDPVCAHHCQKYEHLVTMDPSLFCQFYWSEGVWRHQQTLSKKDKLLQSVTKKFLDCKGDSLDKLLSQPSIFKPTLEPFMSIVEQFLQQQHRGDKIHNIHHMIKVAEELVNKSFTHYSVNWTENLDEIQKELKKRKSRIIVQPERVSISHNARKKKLDSDNENNFSVLSSSDDNDRPGGRESTQTVFNIPQPLKHVWMLKHFRKKYYKNTLGDLPSSFQWLVSLGSLVCETVESDILYYILQLDKITTKKEKDIVNGTNRGLSKSSLYWNNGKK
ncbi:TATA box-binding protein-associated factor RNA polymerase I subunit B isoform X2 [Cherax quadricarinatus]|uniref:TATA box-binding protein-associated factor RNA polymerase I subunit B isoform X2 n=1 Tax=Cherax quadricarinatus TaxID=27406 RepID=UPI002378AA62|nr:TATA box-binding protein-associated factor RNA polymerase I subunit B-like isoform X2 [Cherax quadricarinatus]